MDAHRGRRRTFVGFLLACGLLSSVAGAAERQATPGPDQEAPSQGVTTDHLTGDWVGCIELPESDVALALTRVTLSHGAEATAFDGIHLFVVETGVLTVQEYARLPPTGTPEPFSEAGEIHRAGPPVAHGAGDQFRVGVEWPAQPLFTNEGTEPAVALVVSLMAAGGNDLGSGWSNVEPLAAVDGVRVGLCAAYADPSPLTGAAVSLDRVRYDRGAGVDFAIRGPSTRLLVVESGVLNVQSDHAAGYQPAGAEPEQLPPNARVSLLPGDQLFVGPGTIATRNVARGPSAALMITISQVYTAGPGGDGSTLT